ncbi:prepilin peptidase [Salmonella enterica subsp. enterica]|nr:prepilin peptidase [Salmonella enterica]EBH8631194.1 prepilin peptidase [Salmonella enterica subsp. enterica serovar Oranienburg]EBK1881199.1 prepilin peptidase [Salmonella enterica subsp. enterica serovar Give]ECI2243478.1 prepilin peptidase [Salmonella enterica subsp. enterica]EDA1632434.1 prepilin peptidase [Salmonella enterica subsp. enterica serovar Saintpaul]EDJ3201036.1 prepilin peptidase [Salmonella enterica subsp. enterica serovar Poona]EDS8500620.1 prepilin peptidase [Salmonella 
MFFWLVIVFVSTVVGSFLNVVICRLPLILSGRTDISLSFPSSHCPLCGNLLKKRHIIPVLSYLYYKGKCAWCGGCISLRYPVVEILVVLLSVLGWERFCPDYYLFIGWFIISVFSVTASFIDLDTKKIPDVLTWSLLIIGIVFNLNSGFVSLEESVSSAIFVFILLHLFSSIMSWACKKQAIGGGDIKFFSAIAAWFGISCIPFIVFSSSLITLIAILIVKSKDGGNLSGMKIPFAPGISLAVALYVLGVYAVPFSMDMHPFFL